MRDISRGAMVSSTFHHLGLASILHRIQLRSSLGTGDPVGSSFTWIPAFDVRPLAEVGVGAVTADARRFV